MIDGDLMYGDQSVFNTGSLYRVIGASIFIQRADKIPLQEDSLYLLGPSQVVFCVKKESCTNEYTNKVGWFLTDDGVEVIVSDGMKVHFERVRVNND